MSELDDIQASLARFTRQNDESVGECFSKLRLSSFFDPVPDECLMRVAEHAVIKSFAAGESLTNEGDILSAFYVLLSGTTTVYVHDKIVGTIVGGECIGEGTFFASANILRTTSVVADETVLLAEFDKEGVRCLLDDDKLMIYMNKALLIALFKKLQGANRRIQDLCVDGEL